MLGMLLITWENGSIVKTYGLNQLKSYNMKFTFICIVIIISCSVCASGDVEIYPGLKFDLSSGEQPSRVDNGEDDAFYHIYRRRPWQNFPVEDYRERKPAKNLDFSSLPERLRHFEELLNRNRHKNDEELPYQYNAKPSLEDIYDEYRNLEKAQKLSQYNFQYSNPQILDDVRPYAQEDDFTFGEDDDGEEESAPNFQQEHGAVARSEQLHKEDEEEDRSLTEKSVSEEASGKGAFDEAKFVEDPTDFAYVPTDPRFFQKTNDGPKIQTKPKKLKDNNIEVSPRNDESLTGEQNDQAELREDERGDHVAMVPIRPQVQTSESAGVYIIAVVAGISAAATVGLIAVGIGWYNLQKHVKNASDVEYPAYGVTGPNKDASPSGDRRLAQSAQMYHYQHQKQQIIAMESRAAAGDRHGSVSEADSDEENEEGDYTVYECPGLAPTGEMEVKNPLFQDDPTPTQTPPVKPNEDGKK